MLDEHLELLDRFWTGQPVRHEGPFYRTAGPGWSAVCHPPPLQQPRIPVWVAGTWPRRRPVERAARRDGFVPMRTDGRWEVADTGATWWVEAVHPWRYGWSEGSRWPGTAMRRRIDAGP